MWETLRLEDMQPQPTLDNLRERGFPELVCAWYAKNRRQLPWRENTDPYRVWVSEIMLQQTRVEAVKPYFARFLEALPDCAALAACPEDKLLKLWEGLGYYRRVRHMQEAAGIVVKEYGGILPADYQKLLALPGIGSYTAGAVASIAFGLPVPAVDGNVLRILARLMADDRDVLQGMVKKEAEQSLTTILQEWPEPGAFNQGMMDLGAMVCLPKARPLCESCPLETICRAHEQHRERDFPVRGKSKERRLEQRTILLVRDGERTALVRRPDTGLLAGMYEFPNIEGTLSEAEALKAVEERGLEPLFIQPLAQAKHLFSHVEWRMTGYEIRIAAFAEKPIRASGQEWILAESREIEKAYPLPSALKAYAQVLQLHIGAEKKTTDEAIAYREEDK